MNTIIANLGDRNVTVERLQFLLGTFYSSLPVAMNHEGLVVLGDHARNRILIPPEGRHPLMPQRMWINQPSTNQPFHSMNGMREIAFPDGWNEARVFFLEGDVVSCRMSWLHLSAGWPESTRTGGES